MEPEHQSGAVAVSHGNHLLEVKSLTQRAPSCTSLGVTSPTEENTNKDPESAPARDVGVSAGSKWTDAERAREAARALRALADRLERGEQEAGQQPDRDAYPLIGQVVKALAEERLAQCRPGDWRAALSAISEASHCLDAPLAEVLEKHVNSDRFLGEEREVPGVADRLELVRTLNAVLDRVSMWICLPGRSQPPSHRTNLVIAGRGSVFCVRHKENPDTLQTTATFAGLPQGHFPLLGLISVMRAGRCKV
ncbi:MAG: hypothetical protein U0638_12390 [Phycisphaerales bacterium]